MKTRYGSLLSSIRTPSNIAPGNDHDTCGIDALIVDRSGCSINITEGVYKHTVAQGASIEALKHSMEAKSKEFVKKGAEV
jgi:hypothetical protein